MPRYYVNKNAQDSGDHEVHTTGCSHMPDLDNCYYLGIYTNCRPAVRAASHYFDQVDGCFYCCNECNTG